MEAAVPPSVLARYAALRDRPFRLHGTGLINRTLLVEGRDGPVILQRLHPVFAGTVNHDIEAVTAHLAEKGLVTPRIVRTDDGALWVDGEDERPWRALTFIEGETHDRITSACLAAEAGRLVGLFHLAVADLTHEYRHTRAGVHDTRKHLSVLEEALRTHRDHRLYAEVAPLGRAILSAAERLPDFGGLPLRNVHGDLKIGNLMFRDDHGLCLVDLDTLGKMVWPFEMGDALRSWCNPSGEDEAAPSIKIPLFAASLAGYGAIARASKLISEQEALSLVDGLSTICLELSARFLADALREVYFGFDAARFPARGEHNLLRAKGQFSLYESVERQRAALEGVVRAALLGE
ncbi:MAG: aminoglycoside phosphotransferase family protein [Byssovorax sp.]